MGYSGNAAATEDYEKGDFDPEEFDEEEWHNDEGELKIPEEIVEKTQIEAYDPDTGEKRDDIRILSGKNQNALPLSERPTTHGWSDTLYVTLYETSLPDSLGGYSFEVSGGIRVNQSSTETSVSIDFTVSIGATDFELWGAEISQSEEDGWCGRARTHPAVPLEFEPCVDISWGVGTTLDIELNFDVCTTDACDGWDRIDCQVCKGVGASVTIDPEECYNGNASGCVGT